MTSALAPLVAVVPVRGLPAGKRRLAALLDVEQRNSLVRSMLEDVVRALQGAPVVDDVVICSRDAAAAEEAARLGADFLQQPEDQPGFNAAVRLAQRELGSAGALLVVPADLPLLTVAAVHTLVDAAPPTPAVVIAPAHNGGTNGLLLRPPGVIAPLFGPASAQAHRQAAAAAGEAGVPLRVVPDDAWARDIDSSDDLRWLAEVIDERPAEVAVATRAALASAPLSAWREMVGG